MVGGYTRKCCDWTHWSNLALEDGQLMKNYCIVTLGFVHSECAFNSSKDPLFSYQCTQIKRLGYKALHVDMLRYDIENSMVLVLGVGLHVV